MRSAASRRRVVVSLEQALALPYATLRFVHLGWRVIKVEPTPVAGRVSKGDPNRWIGRPVAGQDRHSYFVAPNVGKEAIAVDLKAPEGRDLLHALLCDLEADVFCTNTLPAHHRGLGIDYPALAAIRPGLVWAAISALGTAAPDVPGYDPAIQALVGYMDLTGQADGPPLQCGVPLVDLKAGDELFAQVLLALLEREAGGGGRRIDVSMARVAASWLQTFLPMLEMGSPPEEIRRHGNEHRQFIPVNSYPAADGWIFLAIGSDAQWERFVGHPYFATLADPALESNEGRRARRHELHAAIGALTAKHDRADLARALTACGVPHAPITPIEEVMELPAVAPHLTRTPAPDGRTIRLPPAAVDTEWLTARRGVLDFAPAYGQHTDALLREIGRSERDIERLRRGGIVA